MQIVTCRQCGAKNRVDERAAATSRPVCGQCGASLRLDAGAPGDTGHPVTVTDATFARGSEEGRKQKAVGSGLNYPQAFVCLSPESAYCFLLSAFCLLLST